MQVTHGKWTPPPVTELTLVLGDFEGLRHEEIMLAFERLVWKHVAESVRVAHFRVHFPSSLFILLSDHDLMYYNWALEKKKRPLAIREEFVCLTSLRNRQFLSVAQ